MNLTLANQVRAMALLKYVQPAKKAGKTEFSIAVKELLKDLEAIDFPLNYTPLVCNSIKTKGFQRENHLEIASIEGPKSQTGTRVVVHYRLLNDEDQGGQMAPNLARQTETPRERARRLADSLEGMLRKEIAEYGGAESFIRWVRSDDEDAA